MPYFQYFRGIGALKSLADNGFRATTPPEARWIGLFPRVSNAGKPTIKILIPQGKQTTTSLEGIACLR
jgi:hypothetical protein